MTTQQKLSVLHERTGRTWLNIAELLGISRQMLDFVRKNQRNFSPEIEARLDEELSKITTAPSLPDTKTTQIDKELLHQLYKLVPLAAEFLTSAYAVNDKAAMVVPGLILNFISLIKSKEDDPAALSRISTALHLMHTAEAADISQMLLAKNILDSLQKGSTASGEDSSAPE